MGNNLRNTIRYKFKRQSLLYDIANYAFVEGDVMQTDSDHLRQQVQDIIQEGNIDRVNRVLALAFSECDNMLFPYTTSKINGELECKNSIEAPEEYMITLSVPETFAPSTASLLGKLLHEYMVCRVLSDWMSITYPQAQVSWQIKLEDIQSRVRQCINFRTKKVRRRISVL